MITDYCILYIRGYDDNNSNINHIEYFYDFNMFLNTLI